MIEKDSTTTSEGREKILAAGVKAMEKMARRAGATDDQIGKAYVKAVLGTK